MGLKDLFINRQDGDDNEKAKMPIQTKKTEETLRFPERVLDGETTRMTEPTSADVTIEKEFNPFDAKPKTNLSEKTIEDKPKQTSSSSNVYLNETTELYNSGLAKLNKDGVDFYEFYQSVKGNIDNSQAYQMAFNMCKAMNPTITKESMIDDADFYLSALNDAYEHYKGLGEDKLSESESMKSSEEADLREEVSNLESQIAELTKTLKAKQLELDSIDGEYKSSLETIKLKLNANKLSMDNLVKEITKVVSNIKNNL